MRKEKVECSNVYMTTSTACISLCLYSDGWRDHPDTHFADNHALINCDDVNPSPQATMIALLAAIRRGIYTRPAAFSTLSSSPFSFSPSCDSTSLTGGWVSSSSGMRPLFVRCKAF